MSAQWWTFALAAAALIIVPGPDVLLVLRNGIAAGRRSALATMLGISSGLLVHIGAAVVGLSALLAASATAFTVVKILGAIYLVWLGVQALRSALRGSGDRAAAAGGAVGPGRGYRQGLVSNVLNPKIAVFFLTLLPQFIDPARPVLAQTLLLGATFLVLGMIWLTALALGVARFRAVLARRRVRRGTEAFAGVVFIGFGVRLVAAS